jgi:Signal transduction histidine kinase
MKTKLYLLLFFLILSNSLWAISIDSLKVQLNKSNTPEKIDILIQLSKAYWTISPSKGIVYANEAVMLAEKYHEQHKKAIALLYGGVNAYFMGVYDNAIQYYQKSLTIARKLQDQRICAYNLNNLGMVNTSLKNYKEAIKAYTESSRILINLGDTMEYAKIQNNIAELNMITGNLDSALKLNLLVLKISKKSNDKVFLIWLYNNIGMVYKKKNDNKLALQYFNKSLNLSNKLSNTLGKAQALNSIGEVYLQQKDYTKANEFFFNALKLAIEVDAKENISETYKNISEYYAAINSYRKALEYYKLYRQLNDSIINDNKIHTIIEMQARYNLEDAVHENRLLQKNIEIKELTLKKNNTQRIFLLISLLMTTMLIILTYSRLMIKKEKNKELHEKNVLINEQKNQLTNTLIEQQKLNEVLQQQKEEIQAAKITLELTNRRLEETNFTKDKFFSIIAHDLRGPVGSILSFSTIIQNKILKYSDQELSKFITVLTTAAQSASTLLENLLTWARSQKGEIIYKPELYNLKNIIDESIAILELKASSKNIKIINKCSESCIYNFDSNMIKTTITNLLNNATKYTNRDGQIEVDVQIMENNLLVSVSDNGIGMKPEQKEKLFKIDAEQYTQKGIDGEKGTGLGLILCSEFIKKHGGKIWVESELGKGSSFYFTIPYIKS